MGKSGEHDQTTEPPKGKTITANRSKLTNGFNKMKNVILHGLAVFLTLFIVSSCSTLDRDSFTNVEQLSAIAGGVPSFRYSADASLEELRNVVIPQVSSPRLESAKDLNLLAISAGGGEGAFAAGVLNGWTQSGNRPDFDIVTGVSAGALAGMFAFVGPEYDPVLKEVFTSGVASQLDRRRPPPVALLGESLLDSKPMEQLLEQYVDPTLVRRIAEEHQKGKRLFVLTTNLDSQRSIVWNMGAIANAEVPGKVDLIRKVLRASTAVPGIFPAVPIPAMSGNNRFEELHTDGGVSRQVYIIPDALLAGDGRSIPRQSQNTKRNIYVIINNNLAPQFEITKRSTLQVVSRAYATIVKSSAQSTIASAHAFSVRNDIGFNLTYVDQYDIPYKQSDPFNTEFMRSVYRIGLTKGLSMAWAHEPPLGSTKQ